MLPLPPPSQLALETTPGCRPSPGTLPPPATDPPLTSTKRTRTQRRLLDTGDSSDGSDSPPRQTRSASSRDSALSNRPSTPTSASAPAAPPAETTALAAPAPAHTNQLLTANAPAAPPTHGHTSGIYLNPTSPLSPSDCLPHLWLSFSVHEHLNLKLGLPEYREIATDALTSGVMPDSEVIEFHSCRHAFPHVPQKLFPSCRPDGLPGQYLHLTQIPLGTELEPSTGLSRTYQIIIRFDSEYHRLSKQEVQEAATARFAHMKIPLSNCYREPVSAIVNRCTHGWLGFLRVDLLNPEIDALALLQGHRVFALTMHNSELVIGNTSRNSVL